METGMSDPENEHIDKSLSNGDPWESIRHMQRQRFKEGLFELGWSQTTFSKKTGIPVTTVRQWVTGEIPQIPKWVDSYMTMARNIKSCAKLLEK